jgi:hypothetical protein
MRKIRLQPQRGTDVCRRESWMHNEELDVKPSWPAICIGFY